MKSVRKSKKWDNFKNDVIKYIEEKGIASMNEVYEISTKNLRMLYATSYFEKLASFLVTNCGCFRIDLTIPNPKPLAIYPNHHKISSTTFFVLDETDDNHFSDVEKAKNILKDLTNAALKAEKLKWQSKKKKVKTEKIDLDLIEKNDNSGKYRENQFRARDCMVNGFIPMVSVQMQMIHQFIFDTFGCKSFTIEQFINNMSLDFMSKVVGIKNMPPVLLKDLRFRHILVSCLPKRIQDQIQLSEAPQVLLQNFKRISDYTFGRFGRQFLTKVDEDSYQLIDSIKIKFLDKFDISYKFDSQEQINEFHFMLQIIDLLENIDPHSYSLWLKRYSCDSKLRGEPTNFTRKIVDVFITYPYNKTFPFFFPNIEQFVSIHGQNWCNLKSSLIEFFQKEENEIDAISQCLYPNIGPVNDFCNGTPLKPEPFTLFSNITSKDFEFRKSNSNETEEDENDKNYYDPNLFFNFLSALMKLFPSGLITSMNDMWDKAMPIFTEVTGVQAETFLRGNTPNALHYILRLKFPEYRDLCAFSTANESIKVRKYDQRALLSLMQKYDKKKQNEIDELRIDSSLSDAELELKLKTIRKRYILQSEVFEMTTSDYLDRFNTKKLRYVLSRPTAEMVERLKALSLTPLESITVKYAKSFLAEIEDIETNGNDLIKYQRSSQLENKEEDPDYINSTVVNGVLFLKLSNFYSQRSNNFKNRTKRFLKNSLSCELYTITPSIVFKDMIYFFNVLQRNPFVFSSRAQINCGAIPFFLDDKFPLSLDLECKGGGKRRRQQKNTNDYSNSESENESDLYYFEDDEFLDDDVILDSSYILGKLSNYENRRINTKKASNLSSIVKKLRYYDSVSVKINGLLLPSLVSLKYDIPSVPEPEVIPKKKRGRGQKRIQPNSIRKKEPEQPTTISSLHLSSSRLSKLESAMSQCSTFINYPSDSSTALYTSFMQLFVVIFQAWNGPDSQSFVLVCRLLYAFIDHKFASGASLDSIFNEFASFDIAYIFSGLAFLQQFDFIYKLSIDTAMPYFLSDNFAQSRQIKIKNEKKPNTESNEKPNVPKKGETKKNSNRKRNKPDDDDYFGLPDSDSDSDYNVNANVNLKGNTDEILTFSELIVPHIWINANGVFDWNLMHRIMRKIVEIVQFEPGIEFTELAGRLPSISATDLFTLVDSLECDEVIYSIFLINDDTECDELEKPLFAEEVKTILSPPVDCTMYMYSLAVNMKNPLLKPAVRRNIYPTERCLFNLALVVEDESFF